MPPFSLSVFLQAPFSREDENTLKVGLASLPLVGVFYKPPPHQSSSKQQSLPKAPIIKIVKTTGL
jgi:hypothetical protein